MSHLPMKHFPMRMLGWIICGLCLALVSRMPAAYPVPAAGDPLEAWRHGVRVHPVSTQPGQHTIHAYYVTSPESPDGSKVLFYASTTPEGHTGEIRVLERATGHERTLARNVTVEDAHRAACQQWVSGGKRVVFHDCRQGQWVVVAIDLATGKEQILAQIAPAPPLQSRRQADLLQRQQRPLDPALRGGKR